MGPRVRAALVLVFVLALGILVGIAFERHRPTRSVETMSVSAAHEAAMAELREELGLDAAQAAQIRAILAKHHEAVQRSWEALRPEVRSAMRQVHVEIAEVLRPDQRERWHDWLMRGRERSRHGQTQNPRER